MLKLKFIALSILGLAAVRAQASAKVVVTCAEKSAPPSLRFGFSRYTKDSWEDSVIWGEKLQHRVASVDVGQFMNDDQAIYLKVYTPDQLPSGIDLGGFKVRLKQTSVNRWSGTVSQFTVNYETSEEKEMSPRPIQCQSN